MTVSTVTSSIVATSDGTTAVFPFTWAIASAADLIVYTIDAAGAAATKRALTTDYTVTGVGIATGGTITLTAGNPAVGTRVFIASDPLEVQQLLLQQGAAFNPADVMAALDLLTREMQATRRVANNAVQIPLAESLDNYGTLLPTKAKRAGSTIGFDVAGNITTTSVTPSIVAYTSVATMAALRAVAVPANGTTYAIAGYYAANDGGGGVFVYNSADASSDNGGTVIIPNSAPANGRWNRVPTVNNVFDVRSFGAKGDGATNDRAAILATEVAAFAAGGTVLFSPATYAVDNTPGRLGFRVNVTGYGATVKIIAAVDDYATVSNSTQSGTKATDTTIEGLTVDANNLVRGVYLDTGTRCRVIRCTLKNCKTGGVAAYSSDDVEVIGCVITTVKYVTVGGTGQAADGVYFGGCARPICRDCRISDFRRIGIVTESNGATKSSGVRIINNTISNANNCDDSTDQFNAGIWCENTNGGTILANRIFGIAGNAGQTSGRYFGMMATAIGENAAEAVFVQGNHVSVWTGSVSPAGIGIKLDASLADTNLIMEGNFVYDCGQAVQVNGGFNSVTIRDLSCANIKWSSANDGIVFIASAGLGTLTIDNVTVQGLNDADAANDAAHITIYNGSTIGEVRLSHVSGFNLVHRASTGSVGKLFISDASINYGSASSYGSLKATEVYCSNVRFGRYASRNANSWIDSTLAAQLVKFSNCKFDGGGLGSGVNIAGSNSLDVEFSGCWFGNAITFTPTVTGTLFNLRFTGCYANEFGTGGLVLHGGTAANARVFVRSCDFRRSTAVAAFQKNSLQPAKSVFAYNTYSGSMAAVHDFVAPTQDVGTVAA